jgi:hypothetical protein
MMTHDVARAVDPTTADCLAASEASLKAGNQRHRRAERAQLLVCANASCPADIRMECVSRVEEVNRKIPTVIFGAKDASGGDLSAVKVTMDGELLAERLEGTALSVDPGEHTFFFEAPGLPSASLRLVIQEAQKDRHEVVTLGMPPPAMRAAATGASPDATPPRAGSPFGSQKILALAAGGVGLVGIGLGTAFGLMAASQKNEATSACPANPCATEDGADKWRHAGATGNVSTIAFVAGGAAVAAAALLWLTAPAAASTRVGVGPGFVVVGGGW